jgi:hypothetical protein
VTTSVGLRLGGLRDICAEIQRLLDELRSCPPADRRFSDVLASVQGHGRRIEEMCLGVGLTPTHLPAPSRRAYQWLRFLSTETTLRAHASALRTVAELAAASGSRGLLASAPPTLRIGFFHAATIYRIHPAVNGTVHVTAHEAFITAPPTILGALVDLSRLSGRTRRIERGRRLRALLREYASGDAFVRLLREIEFGPPVSSNSGPGDGRPGQLTLAAFWSPADPRVVLSRSRGRHYDLQPIYDRVNATHFAGQIDRPVLSWNSTLTWRKLGHYTPGTDTIVLSPLLDTPAVPVWVVEFIMYHELLHKSLGVIIVNGRQAAHTPAFRRAEKSHPRYAEAIAFLRTLRAPPARSAVSRSRSKKSRRRRGDS